MLILQRGVNDNNKRWFCENKRHINLGEKQIWGL